MTTAIANTAGDRGRVGGARTALCLLVGLLAISFAAAAADDFLAVDEAFEPSAQRVDADHVAVTWQIADSYYLYRHAFDFKLEQAGRHRVGSPEIPAGEKHTDEFFGPVETYRHTARVIVPIETTGDTAAELPPSARLSVTYQGCADAGLCYPPQTRTLEIGAVAEPAAVSDAGRQATTDTSSAGADREFVAQQDDLAARLASANRVSTLGLFFVLGILLAFTPCILPMIPILSGLIVGSNATPARAFVLSLAYVLAMALAYTVFGVIAGYFGANLQAALQMPAVVLAFAGVFAALALATFGLFELQMPSVLRSRIGGIGTRRGGIAGAALMGFFAALIAGPCLAPPLVGALLYISSSGDMLLGGSALFMLGLGLGLPLIVIGTFGARLLPHAGAWMDQVRVLFGVILLGVALWLASRIVDPSLALAGWGLLTLGYGAYLSTLATASTGALAAQRAVVFVLFVYAGCAGVGILAGHGRASQPLAGLAQAQAQPQSGAPQRVSDSPFTRVDNVAQLQAALQNAARARRPALVDFYADWCVECVQMEHAVFADPDVRAALDEITALQVDVTAYDAADRALLQQLKVFGPPTMLFYRRDGEEAADHRLIGDVDSAQFLRHLERATGAAT